VYEAVQRYHSAHGELWKPARMLAKLAAAGGKFNS